MQREDLWMPKVLIAQRIVQVKVTILYKNVEQLGNETSITSRSLGLVGAIGRSLDEPSEALSVSLVALLGNGVSSDISRIRISGQLTVLPYLSPSPMIPH